MQIKGATAYHITIRCNNREFRLTHHESRQVFLYVLKAEQGEPPLELTKETDPAELKKLRKVGGFDLVIVEDTPPALHFDALETTIRVADFVVLPSPPAPMDLQALIETVKSTFAPANVAFRILLTRVSRSLGKALDAQQALMQAEIPAFNGFVRAYTVHEQAALEGITVLQMRGEAQGDYQRIADELMREVNINE